MSITSNIILAERIAEKIRVAGGGDEVDLRPLENILTVVTGRKAAREALSEYLYLLGCCCHEELARWFEHIWHYGDGDWGSAGAYAASVIDVPERVRWLKRIAYRVGNGEITPEWARTVFSRKPWVTRMPEGFQAEFKEMFLSE